MTAERQQQIVAWIRAEMKGWPRKEIYALLRQVPDGLTEGQIEALLTEALTPTAKPRTALRSITRQGRAGRKVKFVPKPFERRPIPGYPGCEIDSNHHVFKEDGSEATYSFNKRFRTCARIKSETGQWKEPSILDLMEKTGFRKAYVRTPKENPLKGYNDLAEAHAEDPEAHPDPNCTRKCCKPIAGQPHGKYVM